MYYWTVCSAVRVCYGAKGVSLLFVLKFREEVHAVKELVEDNLEERNASRQQVKTKSLIKVKISYIQLL